MVSRLPSSRIRPGPADRIVPSWGFSLAVSGRTMPLLVISSRADGWITTRSPSGRSFVAETVAVANVHSSSSWRPWLAVEHGLIGIGAIARQRDGHVPDDDLSASTAVNRPLWPFSGAPVD